MVVAVVVADGGAATADVAVATCATYCCSPPPPVVLACRTAMTATSCVGVGVAAAIAVPAVDGIHARIHNRAHADDR